LHSLYLPIAFGAIQDVYTILKVKVKVKISLFQAVEAHRVARG
jgi:hypothetical protein